MLSSGCISTRIIIVALVILIILVILKFPTFNILIIYFAILNAFLPT
jgi:hypothetical protein